MKIRKLNIRIENKAIISIMLFSIAFMVLIRWNGNSGENYRQIIKSDGYGYYDYFPMIFGEQAIDNQKANGVYLLQVDNNKVVNKYFIGTALLQSPFIVPVIIAKKYNGEHINFHSQVFQKAVSLAALLYLLLGLIAISKLLQLYDIEAHIIAFSLFSVFFGTNILYYSIIEPSMSHVYSFSMISCFLLFTKKLTLNFSPKNLILSSILLSLIIIIRPINIIIVLFLPYIAVSFRDLWRYIVRIVKMPYSIVALLLFFVPISIQMMVWKAQTNHFFLWSYTNEGFYFLKPAFFEFLFSFRKGLFIYSPFVFISIILYVYSKRKNIRELWLSVGFLFIVIYILSSWWNWYYGDSFGARVFIDYLSVITLLLAIGLQNSKSVLQKVTVIIISFFMVINIFQTYQYYHNIMSHFDMNAEKYGFILGRYGEENENILGGNDDIASYHKEPMKNIIAKKISFKSNNCNFLHNSLETIDDKVVFNSENEFGLSFIFPADSFFKYRECYCELKNSTKLISGNMDKTFWTIAYIDSLKNVYGYQKYKINGIPAEKGYKRSDKYRFRLPKPTNSNDMIQIYIWNYSHAKFELNNLEIKISGIIK